jgi:hypothetical protein
MNICLDRAQLDPAASATHHLNSGVWKSSMNKVGKKNFHPSIV